MKIKRRVLVLTAVVCVEILLVGYCIRHRPWPIPPEELVLRVGEMTCHIRLPEDLPPRLVLTDKDDNVYAGWWGDEVKHVYVDSFHEGWMDYLRVAAREYETGNPPWIKSIQTNCPRWDADGFWTCAVLITEMKSRQGWAKTYRAIRQAQGQPCPAMLPAWPMQLYPGPVVDHFRIQTSLWEGMTVEEARQALAPAVGTEQPGPTLVYPAAAGSCYRLMFYDNKPGSFPRNPPLNPGDSLLRRVSWTPAGQSPQGDGDYVSDRERISRLAKKVERLRQMIGE